jgi:hypothetical protein
MGPWTEDDRRPEGLDQGGGRPPPSSERVVKAAGGDRSAGVVQGGGPAPLASLGAEGQGSRPPHNLERVVERIRRSSAGLSAHKQGSREVSPGGSPGASC